MNIKKEELLEILDRYDGVISPKLIDYLRQLINLEVSVLNTDLNKEEMTTLYNLVGFKKIADYNFCNRSLKLIEEKLAGNKLFKNMKLGFFSEYYGRVSAYRFNMNIDDCNIEEYRKSCVMVFFPS